MSIITIRSWFQNRGCQAVLAVVAVLLGIGLVAPILFVGGRAGGGQDRPDPTLFKIAGSEIKQSDLSKALQARRGSAADATGRLNELGMTISNLMDDAIGASLAAKYGVKATDEDLRKMAADMAEQQIMISRLQMQMNKQLKEGATDKDFEAAFKKVTGKTPDEFKGDVKNNVESMMKDPTQRPGLEKQFLVSGLRDAVAVKMQVSEDELKKSYDTYFFNRMAFAKPGITKEKNSEAAEAARAELASGKPFAEVYKKHIGPKPDAPMEMGRSMLEGDPVNKALLDLKPNEVSPVIESFGTPTVYQLIKVQNKPPVDYSKNKATLLDNFKKQKADKVIREEQDNLRKTGVEWSNKELQGVFQVYLAAGPDKTSKKKEDFQALFDNLNERALASDVESLAMAKFVAFDEVYRLSTTDQQKEMREQRAQVIEAVIEYIEDINLRLELADLYDQLGKNEEAFSALEAAAQNNSGGFDSVNESFALRIESKAGSMEKAKKITTEQADSIRTIITDWRKEKAKMAQEEKEMRIQEAAERKRLDAEEKKRLAEEKKRLEEEDKKNKAAEAKPNAPSSAPANPLAPGGAAPTPGKK